MAWLQSMQRFSLLSLNLGLLGMLRLIGLSVVYGMNHRMISEWIVATSVFPVVVLVGVNWFHLRRYLLKHRKPDWGKMFTTILSLLSYSKWVTIASISFNMGQHLPRFFLAIMSTPQEVGQFSMGITFTMFFSLLDDTVRTILFPYITSQNSPAAIRRTQQMLVRKFPSYLIAMVLIICFLVGTQQVIVGPQYSESIFIFIITSISLGLVIYIGIGTMSWHALLMPQVNAITNLIRVGMVGAFCWILIPFVGTMGAALAYAIPLLMGEIAQLVFLHYYLSNHHYEATKFSK